jgi:hypothetical protein
MFWFGKIRSGGAKRGISLKCQKFLGLETRGVRQKVWEGISECQPKTLCITQDADSLVRTAESKHRLPQLFWVYSASRATFSASAVALVGFGRLSEGYYHRCSFSGFFNRLLNLLRFGTLVNVGRALIFQEEKWSFTILAFLDYAEEIPQNWFQINHTEVYNA